MGDSLPGSDWLMSKDTKPFHHAICDNHVKYCYLLYNNFCSSIYVVHTDSILGALVLHACKFRYFWIAGSLGVASATWVPCRSTCQGHKGYGSHSHSVFFEDEYWKISYGLIALWKVCLNGIILNFVIGQSDKYTSHLLLKPHFWIFGSFYVVNSLYFCLTGNNLKNTAVAHTDHNTSVITK